MKERMLDFSQPVSGNVFYLTSWNSVKMRLRKIEAAV
jgi:hypothetical protein